MPIRLAALAASTALYFGPPNIKVEAVTDPAGAPVPGAVFIVTGRHHVSPDAITVSGRAEGIVAGKRVTRTLTLTPAGSAGVYGVTRQWSAGQPWVLVFTVSAAVHDADGIAEAVVRLGADGKVAGIDYPMGTLAGGTPWPRRVRATEIDAALIALAEQRP
jgi:hypothetical protein